METKEKYSRLQNIRFFFKERPPIPILVICIFEFTGLILLPFSFVSNNSAAIGVWYQIYILLTVGLSIAIIYTLWKMKKAGIWVYLGSYVVHNIVAVIAGNWMLGLLVIPVIGSILISLSRKKFH